MVHSFAVYLLYKQGATGATLRNLTLTKMNTIETLKKGAYFKRKEGAAKTYIRGAYNRAAKAYECQNFDDISDYAYIKAGKPVFTNFEF